MATEMERLLAASIEYVDMKRMLKEQTDALAHAMHENDLLRDENRLLELKLQLLELKLQRIAQPRIVA
jgi:hypothetical protein